MIQHIEERALNAWPGARQLVYDGWLLRFAGGYTRRANSISPFFPSSEEIVAKIDRCEELYAAEGLPTVFKLLPNNKPDGLDHLLEERGYYLEAESEVLYAPLAEVQVPVSTQEAIILPQEEWLPLYASITGQSQRDQQWHHNILHAIIPAVCSVAIMREGHPAAVGLGVLECGMVGLYDLVVDAQYRRQGLASQLITAILSWAASHGAHGTYLQVMCGNTPAQTLYVKMGYRLCYRYWYRVKQCN